MITVDVRCVQCEYNLRGLSESGLCPECGSSIAVSLRAHYDPRCVSGKPYRKAALVGLCCVLVGVVVLVWPEAPTPFAKVYWLLAMLSFAVGILIEVGVVVMSARFYAAAHKIDHRDMVVALIISIPFVPIAIVLGPPLLMRLLDILSF